MWIYLLGIIVFIMIKICIAIKEWLTVVSLQPTVSIIFLHHQHLSKYCKHNNIACTISDKKGFLNKLTWILFSAFLNVCIIYRYTFVIWQCTCQTKYTAKHHLKLTCYIKLPTKQELVNQLWLDLQDEGLMVHHF